MDIIIREWKIEDKSELAENLNNMNILNNIAVLGILRMMTV